MSRSAGTGSPLFFMCREARRIWYTDVARTSEERKLHRVTLTGRTRARRSAAGHAVGVRSRLVERQYACSCGHVGWSNHMDLERMEFRP